VRKTNWFLSAKKGKRTQKSGQKPTYCAVLTPNPRVASSNASHGRDSLRTAGGTAASLSIAATKPGGQPSELSMKKSGGHPDQIEAGSAAALRGGQKPPLHQKKMFFRRNELSYLLQIDDLTF
jgi:hypothetical protein